MDKVCAWFGGEKCSVLEQVYIHLSLEYGMCRRKGESCR